jgi:hypothetical protein
MIITDENKIIVFVLPNRFLGKVDKLIEKEDIF